MRWLLLALFLVGCKANPTYEEAVASPREGSIVMVHDKESDRWLRCVGVSTAASGSTSAGHMTTLVFQQLVDCRVWKVD